MSKKTKHRNQEKRLNLCGIHLRNIRSERNMKLADIQAALETDYGIVLDRTNLGRIENGERAVTDIELAILAHLLEVPIERLLWGETPPDASKVGEVLKQVKVRYATRRPRQ